MFWQWARFGLCALLFASGIAIMVIATFGVYRFKYVLNRMHVAALGDTLGLLLAASGLMLANGLNFDTLKLLLVIMFFWLASPVATHLIARLETTTDQEPEKHYAVSAEEGKDAGDN